MAKQLSMDKFILKLRPSDGVICSRIECSKCPINSECPYMNNASTYKYDGHAISGYVKEKVKDYEEEQEKLKFLQGL